MRIYHYGEQGEYLGPDRRRECLEGPGVFLRPKKSTFVEPPDAPAGQVAVFNAADESWRLVPDYRGPVWSDVDKSVTRWTRVGPLPSGYMPTPPPSVLHVWNEVKAEWQLSPEIELAHSRRLAAAAVYREASKRASMQIGQDLDSSALKVLAVLAPALGAQKLIDFEPLPAILGIAEYALKRAMELHLADLETVKGYDAANDPGWPG